MAAQKQDDQHERTFSSYVRIRDVVLKTYLGRWMIGRSGERGSGISVRPARYDDDEITVVDNFTYLGSRVSSSEAEIKIRLAKTSIDRLSVIWKSGQTDKIKRSFFQAAVVSILLHGCTTWTLTKRMEKSLTATTQECCLQYWTSPGGSTPQGKGCMVICHPSWKLLKSDEPYMRDTAEDLRTNS